MASPPGDPTSSEPTSQTLERQFEDLGWCPHQYRRLQQERSNATLRYLSTLDRRNFRPTNHRACQLQPSCVANNVDMENYVTKHTDTCSGDCSFIGVDYDHIVDIIREGGVPIIGIHLEPTSTSHEPVLRLTVTPRRVSTRYTVISHVWFDGLGNPSANALPACQIQRLYAQLTTLPLEHESSCFTVGSLQIDWWRQSFIYNADSQPPLFWMDTLCIPVQPEESHLRTKAINQMASIYAAANQELVLDAELMQCEVRTTPALNLLARMACSAWMTRSWTLQEGVLARECVFQFKDCAIDPTHEWCLYGHRPRTPSGAVAVTFPSPAHNEYWAVYRELYTVIWDALHQDWKSSHLKDPPKPDVDDVKKGPLLQNGRIYRLPTVDDLSDQSEAGADDTGHFITQLGETHRLKQLVDTWNELAQRSTTKPEDLHVIIANLLDFNAYNIMDLPNREERMRAIILSFDLLPVSLFWNTGPRWQNDGRTEAACNNRWIPVEPSRSQLSLTPVMKVNAEWLDLDLQRGLAATQVISMQDDGYNIVGQTSFVCSVSPQQAYQVFLHDEQREAERATTRVNSTGKSHYLIIENLTLPSTGSIRGALFHNFASPTSDQDDVIRLTYVCPVSLHQHQRGLNLYERRITALILPSGTKVAVKYDPIPKFTPHPRRLTRGATYQGGIVIIMLLPIPIVFSIGCLVAFIITMARPPHAFTPVARDLLTAFIVLYFGSSAIAVAWFSFLSVKMYRMWLESFEAGWAGEQRGWWGRYTGLERWFGQVEHRIVVWVRRGAGNIRRRLGS